MSSPVLYCSTHSSFCLPNLLSRELVLNDSQWSRLQNIDHCFRFLLKLPVKTKPLVFQHKHTKRRYALSNLIKALRRLQVLIELEKKTLDLIEIEYPYPSIKRDKSQSHLHYGKKRDRNSTVSESRTKERENNGRNLKIPEKGKALAIL